MKFVDINLEVGYALHDSGFEPDWCYSVGEFTTAGYGDIDDSGDLKYPLVVNQKTLSIIPRNQLYIED